MLEHKGWRLKRKLVGGQNAEYVAYASVYGVDLEKHLQSKKLQQALQNDFDDLLRVWYGSSYKCKYDVDLAVVTTGACAAGVCVLRGEGLNMAVVGACVYASVWEKMSVRLMCI